MLIQVISTLGMLLTLLAYGLLQLRGMRPDSIPYLAINLSGGLLLAWVAIDAWIIGLIMLNIAWSLITIQTGIAQYRRSRRPATPPYHLIYQ